MSGRESKDCSTASQDRKLLFFVCTERSEVHFNEARANRASKSGEQIVRANRASKSSEQIERAKRASKTSEPK